MLLRGENGWRARTWAIVLVTIVGCAVFAPSAMAAIRHYEKVSPADKGQGDIVGDGITTIAAAAGDAVAFNSRTPFGDTVGSGLAGQTQYVARRYADGWTTHAVTPTPRPESVQTFLAATKVQFFSDDLRTANVWAYDLPGVDGDAPLRNNIYEEDTETRVLRPITISQVDPLFFAEFLTQTVWGLSADAKHVAFVTSTQMLPDAAPGVRNVYQWDDGVLSVAGVLPDGTVPAGGSDVVPANYRRAMSENGARLAFTASPSGGPSQLYLRIDGRRTVWVSQPEGSDQSDPVGVRLQAMTPDGHDVFFVTDTPLLDEDTNGGPDVYRYSDSANPAADGNLTLVTHDGDVPDDSTFGAPVVGVSDDGGRVYYHTITGNLEVWDHGTTRLISSSVPRDAHPERHLAAVASQPGFGRVTPDGMYLAFATDATLGSDQIHGLTGQVTNGHIEMYAYGLKDDRLRCLSCPSRPATADATVLPAVTSGPVTIDNIAIRPRFLSDRGQVFFSTPEALVPEDRNGVLDAYAYDPASGLSLLSTGEGREPASFADASASGDDVFLVTRQRLVAVDRDNLVDMYDARVGPSFPEQPTTGVPPCDGEGCQPPLSARSPDDDLGTLSFDGRAGPASAASEGFAIRRHLIVSGTAGFVRVRFFAAGKLEWRGRGLRRNSVRQGSAGAYRLRLRLTKRAQAHFRRTGSYVTTVRLTFSRLDGTQVRGATRVTFRAAAKRGR